MEQTVHYNIYPYRGPSTLTIHLESKDGVLSNSYSVVSTLAIVKYMYEAATGTYYLMDAFDKHGNDVSNQVMKTVTYTPGEPIDVILH